MTYTPFWFAVCALIAAIAIAPAFIVYRAVRRFGLLWRHDTQVVVRGALIGASIAYVAATALSHFDPVAMWPDSTWKACILYVLVSVHAGSLAASFSWHFPGESAAAAVAPGELHAEG